MVSSFLDTHFLFLALSFFFFKKKTRTVIFLADNWQRMCRHGYITAIMSDPGSLNCVNIESAARVFSFHSSVHILPVICCYCICNTAWIEPWSWRWLTKQTLSSQQDHYYYHLWKPEICTGQWKRKAKIQILGSAIMKTKNFSWKLLHVLLISDTRKCNNENHKLSTLVQLPDIPGRSTVYDQSDTFDLPQIKHFLLVFHVLIVSRFVEV